MKLRVKEMREAKNMTQAQFSQLVGVPQQTISALERGSTQPQLFNLVKIAGALGCTIDELVGEESA